MTAVHASAPVLTASDADSLAVALEMAERLILSTIERECEAVRTGRPLAAQALRARLIDASRLYLNAARAARASLAAVQEAHPGFVSRLEEGRQVFAALLRIELAVLAAERAAARSEPAAAATVAPAASADAPRRKAAPRYRSGAPRQPAIAKTRTNLATRSS